MTMVTIYHISVSMVTMSYGRHPWLPTTMACNHGNHVCSLSTEAKVTLRKIISDVFFSKNCESLLYWFLHPMLFSKSLCRIFVKRQIWKRNEILFSEKLTYSSIVSDSKIYRNSNWNHPAPTGELWVYKTRYAEVPVGGFPVPVRTVVKKKIYIYFHNDNDNH